MSGYKNGAFDNQEDYQAAMAAAAWYGVMPKDNEWAASSVWEELEASEREQWRRAARVVREDTRTEAKL